MRLSNSPFPFDPTAKAVSAPGVKPAAVATQPGDDTSFGDLLQAESDSSPRTASTGIKQTTAGAAGRRPAVAVAARTAARTTNTPGSVCEKSPLDAAAEAPAEMLTSVAAAPGGTEPTLGDANPEGAPRSAKQDKTVPADAQAQIAAVANWLSSVTGGTAATEPSIENVQITIDGETHAVSPDAESASPAGMGAGQALTTGTPSPRAVQTAYAGAGSALVAAPTETVGAMPATALEGDEATLGNNGDDVVGEPANTTTAPVPADSIHPSAKAVRTSPNGSADAAQETADHGDLTLADTSPETTTNRRAAADSGVPVTLPRSASMTDASATQRPTDSDPVHMTEASAAKADAGEGLNDASTENAVAEGASTSPQARSARGNNEATLPAGAKFAVRTRQVGASDSKTDSGGQKQSLGSDHQGVASGGALLGTNTAKSKAPMPASASTPAYPSRPNEPSPATGAPLTFDALVKDAASVPDAELTRAAHRAVDSAMAMADHFSTGSQRGVSLQFTVSGVDLAVRVEMRADGVHTVFRTDSPELRSALAQEWQSVVSAQTPDAAQRLVEPVFTSTPSGASTSSDSGLASQRDPANPQRQQSSEAAAQRAAFAASPRRAAAAVTMPAAAPARPIALSTVRHLHTFA